MVVLLNRVEGSFARSVCESWDAKGFLSDAVIPANHKSDWQMNYEEELAIYRTIMRDEEPTKYAE